MSGHRHHGKLDSNGDPKPHRDEARAREAARLDFAGHELASRWGDDSGIEYGDCTCAECRPVLPQWGQPGSARVRVDRQLRRQDGPGSAEPLTDRPFARLL